ncbi:sensor histidine kinase [Rubrobacter marinus]|uniref:Oxygen sensor histidine kinase NreB n=1 Tax=Rubrobacter marinus TaxID=2653852 RepID=A0A6G8PTA3_9ACTN|nr:sensor histidine kinase [Rubrobacter marinus]QIN77660.1 sensor histidine kinase [Rubrobacter marinus]
MSVREGFDRRPSLSADILEGRSDEVIEAYEGRLTAMGSPLVAEPEASEQLKVQARFVLREVVASLRGQGAPPGAPGGEDGLSETIGVSRASANVHAIHSLRAVVAFSEAALAVVVRNLPRSATSTEEVAAVALAIQRIFMERVTTAALAYGNYLLARVHESHADERRRISRELHDRVAHAIMTTFRSLELYEMYETKDPSKAQARLELAKKTTWEALELTRGLSRELRSTSADEGLEVALSDLLSSVAPDGMRSWVSVEGDEALVPPQVRDELFLTLREGVRNAVAHSGGSMMSVKLSITEDHVTATVEDDGRGFDPSGAASEGTGISSMRERVTLLGGTLGLASSSGEGARIEVSVPLPRNRH